MSVAAESFPAARATVAPCHRRAVESVIGDISRRLDEHISLRQMAALAYLSPYHFHRIFRLATGIPPGRFLAALRIDEAKRLLVSSDLSVTEISLAVGYHSLSTFSSQFSRLVGLSPRSLRNLARGFVPGTSPEDAFPFPQPSDAKAIAHVEGRLFAADFSGVAFVGLFPTPLAEGLPVGCTVAAVPGPYRLAAVAEGAFHLLAAALPWHADFCSYLTPNGEAFTGKSDHPLSIRNGQRTRRTDISLGPRSPTDPPILIAPTAMLARGC